MSPGCIAASAISQQQSHSQAPRRLGSFWSDRGKRIIRDEYIEGSARSRRNSSAGDTPTVPRDNADLLAVRYHRYSAIWFGRFVIVEAVIAPHNVCARATAFPMREAAKI
jgi:hypothetical protein